MCSDWLDFMPDDGPLDSVDWRPCVAELPELDGALCWAEEPDRPSLPVPVPCACAKPAPAISAAAATDIIKRLLIQSLLTCWRHPRQQRKQSRWGSGREAVPPVLFSKRAMNRFAAKLLQLKFVKT